MNEKYLGAICNSITAFLNENSNLRKSSSIDFLAPGELGVFKSLSTMYYLDNDVIKSTSHNTLYLPMFEIAFEDTEYKGGELLFDHYAELTRRVAHSFLKTENEIWAKFEGIEGTAYIPRKTRGVPYR